MHNPKLPNIQMVLLPTVYTMGMCYAVICQGLTMELLSPMAVMLEGLGFNLYVAPFLNICVPNLPQGVKDGECQG